MDLTREFSLESLWLCFATMAQTCSTAWLPELEQIAASLGKLLESSTEKSVQPQFETVTIQQPGSAAMESPSFSALDRMLIHTVISTINQVEGSPDLDELDDLAQELVELNDARHQSHFHRGFIDAVMARPLQTRDAAHNQARRAWYLAGHCLGALRELPISDVLATVAALASADKRALLDPRNEAGAMLAPQFVPELLESGKLAEAEQWLEHYAIQCAPNVVVAVMDWADRQLSTKSDLAGVRQTLHGLSKALRAAPPDITSPHVDLALREIERRLAVVLRMEGRTTEAESLLEGLLEGAAEGDRPALLTEQVLIALGIRTLESLLLPQDPSTRKAFGDLVPRHESQLLVATQGAHPSPVALYLLALPAVIGKDSDHIAAERLRRAIGEMAEDGEAIWATSGLMDAARFGLALLELRSNEPGTAGAAAERLQQLLLEGIDAPADLILDAVTDAILRDSPAAAKAAELALQRSGHFAISRLDLPLLCELSPGFRSALVKALEEGTDLRENELWAAWHAVLEGCARSTEREPLIAARALDALEDLALRTDRVNEFLKLLDQESLVDPFWNRAEREEARFQALLRAERIADASHSLRNLAHALIGDGLLDEARDLLDRAVVLGTSNEELMSLRFRLAEQEPSHPKAILNPSSVPVSVLFVGGNETQERYRRDLIARLQDEAPNATIEFELPGWGANWGRLVDHLDDRVSQSDAVVIMRFVRTGLGRALRKSASKHNRPWVACSGHGFDSLHRAILQAVTVAVAAKAPNH